MKKVNHDTQHFLVSFYDFTESKLKLMAFIGIVGFPLYYFVWHDWYPQPYENLALRMTGAVLAIPWLIGSVVPAKFRRIYSVYIFLSIIFCLPFFFSYMWIKNDFSTIWTMSYIAQLFLLFLMVYNWILIYIMSIIGFVLACLTVLLSGDKILFGHFYLEYIPIILFVVLLSIIFRRHESNHKEKADILTSFGASIAHEMRNSLAIVIGASRIITRTLDEYSDQSGDKEFINIQKEDVEEIKKTILQLQNSSFRTSMVIDIILKNIHNQPIESDKFIHLSILDVIETAVNEFGYKETEKEMVEIGPIENFVFNGDRDLMVFVVFNLLKNALVYSTDGQSRIQIWTEIHDKKNTLHIRDNGPGIPKDKLSIIFDRFVTIGKKGGTGLGLTFCKRVMRSFQGDITCRSEVGKYSEFIMWFPYVKD